MYELYKLWNAFNNESNESKTRNFTDITKQLLEVRNFLTKITFAKMLKLMIPSIHIIEIQVERTSSAKQYK
jgi:hypothetical protein